MVNDPDVADQLARRPVGEGRQRVSDWSADHDLLVNIFDRLGDLIVAVVMGAGGKAPTIRRFPRPITAIDEARSRLRQAGHEQLVARLLPAKRGGEE